MAIEVFTIQAFLSDSSDVDEGEFEDDLPEHLVKLT